MWLNLWQLVVAQHASHRGFLWWQNSATVTIEGWWPFLAAFFLGEARTRERTGKSGDERSLASR
jgi:hypothetical protein